MGQVTIASMSHEMSVSGNPIPSIRLALHVITFAEAYAALASSDADLVGGH